MICTNLSERYDDITQASSCPVCGNAGHLRPGIVRIGEEPLGMASVYEALAQCRLFLAIGVPVAAEPASGFAEAARRAGVRRGRVRAGPVRFRSVRRADRRPARRYGARLYQAADRGSIGGENRVPATARLRRGPVFTASNGGMRNGGGNAREDRRDPSVPARQHRPSDRVGRADRSRRPVGRCARRTGRGRRAPDRLAQYRARRFRRDHRPASRLDRRPRRSMS